MKKIYLAAPYSHANAKVIESRVKIINSAAAKLISNGYMVFSPISHSHYIAIENDLPGEFEFWQKVNHSFIEWADIVAVLKIPGWEYSRGIKDEIEYATSLRKQIEYIGMGDA